MDKEQKTVGADRPPRRASASGRFQPHATPDFHGPHGSKLICALCSRTVSQTRRVFAKGAIPSLHPESEAIVMAWRVAHSTEVLRPMALNGFVTSLSLHELEAKSCCSLSPLGRKRGGWTSPRTARTFQRLRCLVWLTFPDQSALQDRHSPSRLLPRRCQLFIGLLHRASPSPPTPLTFMQGLCTALGISCISSPSWHSGDPCFFGSSFFLPLNAGSRRSPLPVSLSPF